MTQENKQLLLIDLCGRLPYGVKVAIEYTKGKYTRIYDLREIDNDVTSEVRQRVTIWNYGFYSSVVSYPLIECRPYLRTMSSMTEEEYKSVSWEGCSHTYNYSSESGFRFIEIKTFTLNILNWLNAHHFDYRNLIPRGLALKASENMYKQ